MRFSACTLAAILAVGSAQFRPARYGAPVFNFNRGFSNLPLSLSAADASISETGEPYEIDVPVNANVPTEYVRQLYRIGEIMLNRAKRVEGGKASGPSLIVPPLWVPIGFEAPTLYLEKQFARFVYFVGRCDTNFIAVKSGGPYPQGKTAYGSEQFFDKIPDCMDEQGIYAITRYDKFVKKEYKKMLAFLKENPGAQMRLEPAATIANELPSRTTPLTYRAVRAMPDAIHRVWDFCWQQARRIANGIGYQAIPDYDNLLVGPVAMRRFDFPPGFEPKGVDNLLTEMLFQFISCRSAFRRRVTAQKWGVPPRIMEAYEADEEAEGLRGPRPRFFTEQEDRKIKKCVDDQLKSFFNVDFRNYAVGVVDDFVDFLNDQQEANRERVSTMTTSAFAVGNTLGYSVPSIYGFSPIAAPAASTKP